MVILTVFLWALYAAISSRFCVRKTLEFVLFLLRSVLKDFATAPKHSAALPHLGFFHRDYIYVAYLVYVHS